MNEHRPKKVLFERVFLWSYIPKNFEGVIALFLLLIPVGLGVFLVEVIGRMLGYDLWILQAMILVSGLVFIQRFVMRHS